LFVFVFSVTIPAALLTTALSELRSAWVKPDLSEIPGATGWAINIHNGEEYIYPVVSGADAADADTLQQFVQTVTWYLVNHNFGSAGY
jgi:hypothetical protein